MTTFYLGIDGGATKTLARLGRRERLEDDAFNQVLSEVRVAGSSLTHDRPAAINNLVAVCKQLLTRQPIKPQQITLACGVAGAGNPTASSQLKARLEQLGFARVIVTSDAQTSLLGAGAGMPIVTVAIGTGSVAMRLDRDGSIHQVGGWGLAVGDEGSGAAIGKSAVRALLWELDLQGRASSPLSQLVMREVGTRRSEILPWLQQAGACEYAALAPIIFAHESRCDTARRIILETARQVDQLITAATNGADLPLAILGGLAEKLGPYLSTDHQDRQIPPLGTSLDGACMLARNEAAIPFCELQ